MKSICGIDCTNCELCSTCNGCAATEGQPFGAECLVAQCCKKGKTSLSELKEKLIAAFNTLQIPDMEEVTELNALKGSFANIEYTLPNGQTVKFWDDNRIYLGNQLHKRTATDVMELSLMRNISWCLSTAAMELMRK